MVSVGEQDLLVYHDGVEVSGPLLILSKTRSRGTGRVVIGREYNDIDDDYSTMKLG